MSEAYVRLRLGRYNLCNPSEQSYAVSINLPGLCDPLSFTIDERDGAYLDDADMPWAEVISAACDAFLERTWISTQKQAIQKLRNQLDDGSFWDAVNDLWRIAREDALRRQIARLQEKLQKVAG